MNKKDVPEWKTDYFCLVINLLVGRKIDSVRVRIPFMAAMSYLSTTAAAVASTLVLCS